MGIIIQVSRSKISLGLKVNGNGHNVCEVMVMPGKLWPIFLWLKSIRNVGKEYRWVTLSAMLMLIVASMVLVVAGVTKTFIKAPIDQRPARYEAETPLPVLKQEESPPQVGGVKESPVKKEVKNKEVMPNAIFQRPLPGEIMLNYGWQEHPVYKDWRFHTGIDIKAEPKSLVCSASNGKVTVVKNDEYYGWMVVVKEDDTEFEYASLAEVFVSPQQEVSAGVTIGSVGQARGEPYPHLHFSIKRNNHYDDVAEFMKKIK
ncbi:MAG: putative peptidase [Firmicutes bacterium]|nr:putative peptidase [Bacillota bacterium]